MGEWLIAPGPASEELALSVAKELGSNLVDIESRIFPDGEIKIKLNGNISNKNVAIVQSTYPPTDRHLLQLLFIANRLSENCSNVCAVIPYLAYSRQDKAFLEGEVVSLAVISNLLQSVGIRKLVTVDIHSTNGLKHFHFPASNVSAVPLLGEYFRSNFNTTNTISVSPDFGGSSRAEELVQLLGTGSMSLDKSRDRNTGEVSVGELSKNVDGKDIILIDDIISTGASMCKAVDLLKKSGARRIYAACTHPLLLEDSQEKLKEFGVDELVGTNTIPSSVSKIDVSSILASHLNSM